MTRAVIISSCLALAFACNKPSTDESEQASAPAKEEPETKKKTDSEDTVASADKPSQERAAVGEDSARVSDQKPAQAEQPKAGAAKNANAETAKAAAQGPSMQAAGVPVSRLPGGDKQFPSPTSPVALPGGKRDFNSPTSPVALPGGKRDFNSPTSPVALPGGKRDFNSPTSPVALPGGKRDFNSPTSPVALPGGKRDFNSPTSPVADGVTQPVKAK